MAISLKETAAVFRLKMNHKNLSTDEYGDNLMQYLDNTRNVETISVHDLSSALLGLKSKPQNETEEQNVTNNIQVGEHVALLKVDEENGVYDWVLGIVDGLVDEKNSRITHMVSTKAKTKWTFPEEADITLVDHEHIFCWNMAVTYC